MPKKTRFLLWIAVLAWAAAIYALSHRVPAAWADLLGFLGALCLFYPTAVTEVRKWLDRDLSLPSRAAAKDDQAFLDEVDGVLQVITSRFSYAHAAFYFVGLSLVALGFGTQYFG